MTDKISRLQGRRLIALARDVIGHRLGIVSDVDRSGLDESSLKQNLATFVTLKLDNQLRGCIGNLEPCGSVVDSIRRNALSAAFSDHRFSPLEEYEYKKIRIDISILTEAKQLHYEAGEELLQRLSPGVDGVILCHGSAKATFLPQVWEQLSDPALFLEQLCIKAGLSRTAWRVLHPDIFIYHVDYFEEETA